MHKTAERVQLLDISKGATERDLDFPFCFEYLIRQLRDILSALPCTAEELHTVIAIASFLTRACYVREAKPIGGIGGSRSTLRRISVSRHTLTGNTTYLAYAGVARAERGTAFLHSFRPVAFEARVQSLAEKILSQLASTIAEVELDIGAIIWLGGQSRHEVVSISGGTIEIQPPIPQKCASPPSPLAVRRDAGQGLPDSSEASEREPDLLIYVEHSASSGHKIVQEAISHSA